jgi:hypothetical protein
MYITAHDHCWLCKQQERLSLVPTKKERKIPESVGFMVAAHPANFLVPCTKGIGRQFWHIPV